eukprot:11218720-Lingulodinium_polyedra.AAC.1
MGVGDEAKNTDCKSNRTGRSRLAPSTVGFTFSSTASACFRAVSIAWADDCINLPAARALSLVTNAAETSTNLSCPHP